MPPVVLIKSVAQTSVCDVLIITLVISQTEVCAT